MEIFFKRVEWTLGAEKIEVGLLEGLSRSRFSAVRGSESPKSRGWFFRGVSSWSQWRIVLSGISP